VKYYEILTPLRADGKTKKDGVVQLKESDAAPLVNLGALREVPAPKTEKPPVDPSDLTAQTVAELTALATAEGVALPEKVTKATLIEAIEAARKAKA
jgi:hypothetical protein